MGVVIHNAVVITTDETHMKEVHAAVVQICGELVSPVVPGVVNGYESFFVAPCGSKRGWQPERKEARDRARLLAWLSMNQRRFGIEWAHVEYGLDAVTVRVSNSHKQQEIETDG